MITLVNRDTALVDIDSHWDNWLFELDNKSDSLLITAGDSWTWGGALDDDKRLDQIYGRILSTLLKSDFINIGLCGGDNISIIDAIEKTIQNLKKSYTDIYVVVTLTELGREFKNSLLTEKNLYELLRGDSWPTYNELFDIDLASPKLQIALNELKIMSSSLYRHINLYLKTRHAKTFNDIFTQVDQFNLEYLSEVKDKFSNKNIKWIVGKNYVNWICANDYLLTKFIKLDCVWTELIANEGKLAPYPTDIYGAVTKDTGFGPLNIYCAKFKWSDMKLQTVELLNQSLSAINWLDSSPYNNSKKGARHPLAIAHNWWANYIYNTINNYE